MRVQIRVVELDEAGSETDVHISRPSSGGKAREFKVATRQPPHQYVNS
jgi:hypothetical protein